jgi:hypothetical protein
MSFITLSTGIPEMFQVKKSPQKIESKAFLQITLPQRVILRFALNHPISVINRAEFISTLFYPQIYPLRFIYILIAFEIIPDICSFLSILLCPAPCCMGSIFTSSARPERMPDDLSRRSLQHL